MGYYEFPHTRNYDTDLGYLIKRYKELSNQYNTLSEYVKHLKTIGVITSDVKFINTCIELKELEDININDFAVTLGYYALNDNGAALYKITDLQPIGYYEVLHNGLYAELINTKTNNIKIFGAYGDNLHDDTNALINAFNYSDVVIFGKNKTYVVNNTINVYSNTKIIGNNATVKVMNNHRILRGIFNLENVENVEFKTLQIDMNKNNMPLYEFDREIQFNVGLYCNNIGNLLVEDCIFKNLYTWAIYLHDLSNGTVQITKNKFNSPLQEQGRMAEHIVCQNSDERNKLIINDNTFENELYTNPAYGVCAVFLNGLFGQTLIDHNKLINCGRDNTYNHRLMPIDIYGNSKNIIISNNIITTLHGFSRIESCENILVKNNKVTDICTIKDTSGDPFLWIDNSNTWETKTKNITIENNDIDANLSCFYCVDIWNSSDDNTILENIKILNNNIIYRRSNPVIYTDGIVNNLLIDGNVLSGLSDCIKYAHHVNNKNLSCNNHKITNNKIIGNRGINTYNMLNEPCKITNLSINNNNIISNIESIENCIPALINNNFVNNAISGYECTDDNNYPVAQNNIFNSSFSGTAFVGPKIIHKNNARNNLFID